MSVNTGALLSAWGRERCSSFCRLQNETGMVEHLESIQIVIKSSNVPHIYDIPILE